MTTILSILLILHGLITAAQAPSAFAPSGGVPNPNWLSFWPANLGQSWLLNGLGIERTLLARAGGLIWLLAGLCLLAAGLALLGWIVPFAWWRSLALVGGALSLFMLLIYLHPFFAIGIGASGLLLAALLVESWPVLARLGV